VLNKPPPLLEFADRAKKGWSGRAADFLKLDQYEEAAEAFSLAEMDREARMASALAQSREVRSIPEHDKTRRRKAFKDVASQLFECGDEATENDELAVIFRAAAECFVELGDHARAAQAYERGGHYSEAASHSFQNDQLIEAISVALEPPSIEVRHGCPSEHSVHPDVKCSSERSVRPDVECPSERSVSPDAECSSERGVNPDTEFPSERSVSPDVECRGERSVSPDVEAPVVTSARCFHLDQHKLRCALPSSYLGHRAVLMYFRFKSEEELCDFVEVNDFTQAREAILEERHGQDPAAAMEDARRRLLFSRPLPATSTTEFVDFWTVASYLP
jgi:hypothetical protein